MSTFHASTRRFWEPEFPGSSLNLAGWAKRLTGLATITVGSVGLCKGFFEPDPSRPDSRAAIAEGHAREEFDLIALGRTMLANSDWVTLVAAGRAAEIVDYQEEHEACPL